MKKRIYFGTKQERLKQAQEKFKFKFKTKEEYNEYCAEKVRRFEERCKKKRLEFQTLNDDFLQ